MNKQNMSSWATQENQCQLLSSDLWREIKNNIRPAACCLTRTLRYTNSFSYLKHKICKKCTCQKLWKSAIQVQLFTTQRDCFSQTETGLFFFFSPPITSFSNRFPLKRAPHSAPVQNLLHLYWHSWWRTIMQKHGIHKSRENDFDWTMTKIFG